MTHPPPLRLDLARLDDPARLEKFQGQLLDRELDAELQAIVRAAAEQSGFPIALVSLVLRRTQLFRAHVGLPPDLATSLATDRCSSFCQYVVSAAAPIEIVDALAEPGLPRDLIERYNIRAYTGYPLAVDGQVLGSLCVIDVRPHRLSDGQRAHLAELARRASVRLKELSSETARMRLVTAFAVEPAFGEMRNALCVLNAGFSSARFAVTELAPAIELLAATAAGRLTAEEYSRAAGALAQAAGAYDDVQTAFREAALAVRRLMDSVGGLEATLGAQPSVGTDLASAIDASDRLAHHYTKLVGGVRWPAAIPAAQIPAPRVVVTSVLATALRLLSERTIAAGAHGIDAQVALSSERVDVSLRVAARGASCAEIAAELRYLVDDLRGCEVEGTDGTLRLTWATRVAGPTAAAS